MLPKHLADKVRKMIGIESNLAVISNIFFSPSFTNELVRQVPELRDAGFNLQQTATENPDGELIEASIVASNGNRLSLGSVLAVGGQKLEVQKPLVTIDSLVEFINNNAIQTLE